VALSVSVPGHETVSVTQLRSVEVGRNTVVQATGLRDSSMLTQDENIVDIRFTVQYRLSDARAYLFENRNPDEAVVQASESAVREIVGRSKVDSVLYEQRDAIAADLVKSVQAQVDRLKAGIVIANVNVQNVQVPDSGPGRLQRRGEGRRRPRPLQERRPGLCQRRGAQGARCGVAPAGRVRRLPRACDRAGRR
jgi:regulator of protease activity HflC (stomatin/prohibitin superfamily)